MAAACFTPTFYLHLVSYYFPIRWRKRRRWILLPAYAISLALAGCALWGRWLIAGASYGANDAIINPLPGPLMTAFVAFFLLLAAGGLAGLVAGYRVALTTAVRNQIRHLLVPSGLLIPGSFIVWFIILAGRSVGMPIEIGDSMLILAAFFFANTVCGMALSSVPPSPGAICFTLCRGRFVYGQPEPHAVAGPAADAVDPFPLPVITGVYVLVVFASFRSSGAESTRSSSAPSTRKMKLPTTWCSRC